MLEYFTAKKIKKDQAEKGAKEIQTPVLSPEDEHFLERIVSAEGTPPPLPDRPSFTDSEVGDLIGIDTRMMDHGEPGGEQAEVAQDIPKEHDKSKGKGKENASKMEKKKSNRFSFLRRSTKKKDDNPNAPPGEQENDINRLLDELNLAAVNNRAFSLSKGSQEIVKKFTVILKDLINGVPTAYDDLVNLIEDSQGTLAKSYQRLPSFLQKLITSLPHKLTSTLAPELLAVATEAQGLSAAEVAGAAAAGSGLASAAKKFLIPASLKDLVTKPGAVVGLLRAIMNALKLRFPALMGTNILFSVALFGEPRYSWKQNGC
jgi:hypothetical protein